jgi:hypothetical protein
MTREIKFIVYDCVKKKIIHWNNIFLLWDWCIYENISETRDDRLVEDEWKYIIMQYTWVQDSTGKDIYECDILQISWYVECFIPVQAVVFDKCMYKVIDSWWWYHCIWEIPTENITIVWNIYENPELLSQ